jgi:hypothetical protein
VNLGSALPAPVKPPQEDESFSKIQPFGKNSGLGLKFRPIAQRWNSS